MFGSVWHWLEHEKCPRSVQAVTCSHCSSWQDRPPILARSFAPVSIRVHQFSMRTVIVIESVAGPARCVFHDPCLSSANPELRLNIEQSSKGESVCKVCPPQDGGVAESDPSKRTSSLFGSSKHSFADIYQSKPKRTSCGHGNETHSRWSFCRDGYWRSGNPWSYCARSGWSSSPRYKEKI
jgi:hypothetical protein